MIMPNRKIILASKSPRRKELLEQIGLRFKIRESEYQEDMKAKDDPYELVKFLALQKTKDVARHYDDAIIIGADAFIIYEDHFIGKPKNESEAKEMLKNFSGKEHSVVSGFAVIDTKNNITVNDYGEAKVKFKKLNDQEIEDYIVTGEPIDKAGGYAIQGKAGGFIESINGDYYSIIGLPLNKVYCALRKMGLDI